MPVLKHINVIPEIFSLLDTALLSAKISGSKDPAQVARKWLIANHESISHESYRLLNSFGLKKKGFNLYLKKWLLQYAERRKFILENKDSSVEQWVLKMGHGWEASGGVFFDSATDDGRQLSPGIIKAAQKKGVITFHNEGDVEQGFSLELAMGKEKQYHEMITYLDKCAVPIVKNEKSESGTTFLRCSSPKKSHLNQLVAETALPFYAKAINGIKID